MNESHRDAGAFTLTMALQNERKGEPHIEKLPPVHGPGQVCGVPRQRASSRTAQLSVSSISPHNFLHIDAPKPQRAPRVGIARGRGFLLSPRNRRAAVNRNAVKTRTRGRQREIVAGSPRPSNGRLHAEHAFPCLVNAATSPTAPRSTLDWGEA